MMSKEELLRFIDNNYADGEQLVWQTISQTDVGASDTDWTKFVEVVNRNSYLADAISGLVYDTFTAWLDGEDEDGDE